MDWKLFWILVVVMVAVYVLIMFYSQRQAAYLSLMLYRQGDVDGYLKELDSWQSKLFFNKKLRKLMEIDAYLAKQDQAKLESLFNEIETMNIPSGDRLMVLQKEMPFYLNLHNEEKVKEIYRTMNEVYDEIPEKRKGNYTQIMKEMNYIYTIHIEKDGKYAEELYETAGMLKDEIPAGVYYFKAAQSYYLQNNKPMLEKALEKAKTRLASTPFSNNINEMCGKKQYDRILDIHL